MSLTLFLLGCQNYPEDANLVVEANPVRYHVYAESAGETYQMGVMTGPEWLYGNKGLGANTKIQITLSYKDGKERKMYDDFLLGADDRIQAPSLTSMLEKAGVIGADCGFHHPDSHDFCRAAAKTSEPLLVEYRVSPFPGEKNTDDNYAKVILTMSDLEDHARYLSHRWYEQEQKEVEEEKKRLAEQRQTRGF